MFLSWTLDFFVLFYIDVNWMMYFQQKLVQKSKPKVGISSDKVIFFAVIQRSLHRTWFFSLWYMFFFLQTTLLQIQHQLATV